MCDVTKTSSTRPSICLDLGSFPRIKPEILQAYLTALDLAGVDPLGVYSAGRRAHSLLQAARESVAESLGVSAAEVRFTANLSVALHTVIGSLVRGQSRRGTIAVLTAVERAAAFNGADFHAEHQLVAPVDGTGRVVLSEWDRLVSAPTTAVAVAQHANQETGIGQETDSLHAIAKSAGIPLIVDASMTLGRTPIPEGWDAIVADGRALGAPVNIGVMIVRHATRWLPVWPEDANSWLPGGVDIAAAFAVAAALESRIAAGAEEQLRQRDLVEHLTTQLASQQNVGVEVVGTAQDRLAPHVVCLSLSDVDGELLATELDRRAVSVGAGSACASTSLEPSHVLRAMGITAAGSIRISVDHATTRDDVDAFLAALPPALAATRRLLSP